MAWGTWKTWGNDLCLVERRFVTICHLRSCLGDKRGTFQGFFCGIDRLQKLFFSAAVILIENVQLEFVPVHLRVCSVSVARSLGPLLELAGLCQHGILAHGLQHGQRRRSFVRVFIWGNWLSRLESLGDPTINWEGSSAASLKFEDFGTKV